MEINWNLEQTLWRKRPFTRLTMVSHLEHRNKLTRNGDYRGDHLDYLATVHTVSLFL